MQDLEYQNALTQYLEGFVSERRKGRLTEVLAERTNHLTVVLEDVTNLIISARCLEVPIFLVFKTFILSKIEINTKLAKMYQWVQHNG